MKPDEQRQPSDVIYRRSVIVTNNRWWSVELGLRPNPPMHPTPLRGPKIVGILEGGFRSTAFPIYWCGAGDGQPVRPKASCTPNEPRTIVSLRPLLMYTDTYDIQQPFS